MRRFRVRFDCQTRAYLTIIEKRQHTRSMLKENLKDEILCSLVNLKRKLEFLDKIIGKIGLLYGLDRCQTLFLFSLTLSLMKI